METLINNSAKRLWLYFPILLAALILTGGCATQTSDPLAGWKVLLSHDYEKFDKAIKDDYQDFIQKLSPKERDHVGDIGFFEDGTGQHAVSIQVFPRGDVEWHYALIYDKENKRIKVTKYGYSRIMS
jgi:hypothetical protein